MKIGDQTLPRYGGVSNCLFFGTWKQHISDGTLSMIHIHTKHSILDYGM